ncbi:hypothetical protein LPUS_08851 [Lasallia pustulata]|uniref:Uncharacterized protein n=1 Tax=Lasallia pustulata TaxID=136370 RepID=A0A1W5D632_9LECA|nr:hypothetical protein LPUS_08851 [Lasallia pustulata]
MHWIVVSLVLMSYLTVALSSQENTVQEHSATIYAWPFSSAQPSKLADLTYDLYGRRTVINHFTAPALSSSPENDLIRIGVYDPVTKAWRGTVTSASSFDSSVNGRLRININQAGEVWGASWHASMTKAQADTPAAGQQTKQFDLVLTAPPPQPLLNRPVVLNPDGKIAEPEPEKTMFQKYWWVLLGVAVLAMAGGGDK